MEERCRKRWKNLRNNKEVKAKLRHLRIAPRKVRLVADQMRGESVAKSKGLLIFTIKKATEPLLKLLNSAVANAKMILI